MYRIGIDLGGTNIKAGLVDENQQIVARVSNPTDYRAGHDDLAKRIGETAREVLGDVPMAELACVGLGAPGLLDNEAGTITDNSSIQWKNYPIRDRLREFFPKVPIRLGNDANVAAWAEYVCGTGRGTDNFILMTLGTGVGGGLVFNRRLYAGSHGIGAELGHIKLFADGRTCGCGSRGCVESYCSATALIRSARRALVGAHDSALYGQPLSARTIVAAAQEGDRVAVEVFGRYTEYLAMAAGSMINLLDPDVIAFGGGVAGAGDFLLSAVKAKLLPHVAFRSLMKTELVIASLGNDAGILGAAFLEE